MKSKIHLVYSSCSFAENDDQFINIIANAPERMPQMLVDAPTDFEADMLELNKFPPTPHMK